MDCLFFINPIAGSGQGRQIASQLEGNAHGPGFSVQAVFIDHRRIEAQVLSLVNSKKLIVIAGGDGTVSAIVSILSKLVNPPPFAILPLGTGNDIAKDIGWWKVWNLGGLPLFFTALKNGKIEPIDLWSCGEKNAFLGYAGLGIDASIVRSFHNMHNWFSWVQPSAHRNKLLYMYAGLKHIINNIIKGASPEIEVRLTSKKNVIESFTLKGNFTFLIANITYYAGENRLSLDSDCSDGLLDIYSFPDIGAYIKFLAKGSIFPGTLQLKPANAKIIDIFIKKNIDKQLDGEWAGEEGQNNRLRIQLLRAMPVLKPPKDFFARVRLEKTLNNEHSFKKRAVNTVPGQATFKRI
ncbi:MAG: diacylglycerol kinase family protein [Desulfobacteraceae bacterium]|nr:diacylglycerol kinase family protein [Desulfobacteraceae bacterium]